MNMLALTIILPLIGFILLTFFHGRWSENVSAIVGAGSVGLAVLVTAFTSVDFFANGEQTYSQPLWTRVSVGDFNTGFDLVLDGLSLTILSVATGVGFFTHMYASWYTRGEEGYSRFFAYTDLLIASMVVLAPVDNLLLTYLGWEGVGLYSYLPIGLCYTDLKNGAMAVEASVVTCVSDVFLAFVLFILYNEPDTLNFREMVELTPAHFADGNNMLMWVTLVLLGGAVGKSVQLPLQTWLADAMAGPTPVSALIHAATMVTVGVYLVARTHGLFLMTPKVLHLAGVVGAVMLLLAGFAVLVRTDIKRVLAYSTMSQIGYMFFVLGVQAWGTAIFHLITHVFFKTLLSLASGLVILACHHEQNIFKMGGLRESIPLVYLCFLVGGAALSAPSLVTTDFLSKDEILADATANGYIDLMMAGLVGASMTSLYTFHMIFIVLHGKEQIHAHTVKGITHSLSLIVLLILSTFAGALIVPSLQGMLLQTTELTHGGMLTLEIISGVVAVVGILLAARLWLGKHTLATSITNSAPGCLLGTWWHNAWGFDWLYDKMFAKPFPGIAWLLERDPLNSIMNIPVVLSRSADRGLLLSENGYLRWYVVSMSAGVAIVPALLMVLC